MFYFHSLSRILIKFYYIWKVHVFITLLRRCEYLPTACSKVIVLVFCSVLIYSLNRINWYYTSRTGGVAAVRQRNNFQFSLSLMWQRGHTFHYYFCMYEERDRDGEKREWARARGGRARPSVRREWWRHGTHTLWRHLVLVDDVVGDKQDQGMRSSMSDVAWVLCIQLYLVKYHLNH